jgi:hypothetical protein
MFVLTSSNQENNGISLIQILPSHEHTDSISFLIFLRFSFFLDINVNTITFSITLSYYTVVKSVLMQV